MLQGFTAERDFNEARKALDAFTLVALGGKDIAIEAARNVRRLRAHGITVRKTIDTIIAKRCIVGGHSLLHSDRDFDAFEEHLGLKVVPSGP